MEAPQETQTEKIAPTVDDADLDNALEQTLAAVDNAGGGFSAKDAAAVEERQAAAAIAAANDGQPAVVASPVAEPQVEEDLASVASKGREYLMQKLREHQERKDANVYVPPPVSSQMQERINEEHEAGRRTQARHQAQKENRPPPDENALEVAAKGSSTPVFRPDNMVPDPVRGGLGVQRE